MKKKTNLIKRIKDFSFKKPSKRQLQKRINTLTLEKESLEDLIKNELYSNFKENQDLREKCKVYKNQIKKYKNKINELRRAN